MNWKPFFRAAVLEVGMSPEQFYKMTPVEFWWLLDDGPAPEGTLENPGITLERVKELMEKYPDGDT